MIFHSHLVSLGLYLVQLLLVLVEGESEVQQLEAAVGGAPHHVRGLQVAVGETVGVEGIKSTIILQKN